MNELEAYITGLELYDSENKLPFTVRKVTDDLYEGTEEESATINFKSVQSFEAGVSAERQEDVLNSLLLAQRVATKAFPDDEQLMDWHKRYFEVLERLGWVFANTGFDSYESQSNLFGIEKILLEVLGTVLTGNQLAIIVKSIQALKSLSSEDKRFVAFEKNTHSLNKGNFQIGIATEQNNVLSISSTAFVVKASKKFSRILFFSTEKENVEFKYCHIKAILNEAQFATGRDSLKKKLGDTSEYIADLDI
ncbi:hypothetical protein B4N84_07580 [Flavobacterium sp. IR1]|nr:hypothetical protein B4N84_07580 [Flavobacterium sp. IR1]